MGAFSDWIRKVLGTPTQEERDWEAFKAVFSSYDGMKVVARTAALQAVANIIASLLAKCEFRTYVAGKPDAKTQEWYRWNVRPSVNYSSSAFLYKIVEKLCFNREALVIDIGGELLCADSFTEEKFAVKENLYTNVVVDNFTFGKTFSESEVMHFRLTSKSATKVVTDLTRAWDDLLSHSSQNFKNALGRRALLKISTEVQNAPDFDQLYADMTGTDLKQFISSTNAVLPIYEGFDYDEIDQSKTYKGDTTRDMAALVDDVYTYTARAFGVSPSLLLNGEAAAKRESALIDTLTLCIDPLAAMMEEEITAKRVKPGNLARGNRVEVDTSQCFHVDTLAQATNVDKLLAASVASPNECRALLRLPPIAESWADEYYRTANYNPVKGGDTNNGTDDPERS